MEEHDLEKIKALCEYEGGEYESVIYPKLEKAIHTLETIFRNNVDIRYLKRCKNANQYNQSAWLNEEITSEEFNTIKEYIKKYESRI